MTGPADASDMAGLKKDLETGKITIVTYLETDEDGSYTHIIKDSGGYNYAVQIRLVCGYKMNRRLTE